MSILGLQQPYCISVVGSPRSGKSHCIRYLLHAEQAKLSTRFGIILVMSKTKFNNSYNYIPSQWVHGGYKEDVLAGLMRVQAGIREQGKVPPKVLIIFDDCISPAKFKTDFFKSLLFNRRHFNISIIIAAQYLLGNLTTDLREVTDGAIVFKQRTNNAIKGCYEAFAQMMSEQEFRSINESLVDYKFLFTDPHASTYIITKCPAEFPTPRVDFFDDIDINSLPDAS